MSAHLLLDGVSKSFSTEHAPALDDVTLEVPAGSCTAILGPSGSGKSTILRVMAGLDFVTGGQVLVNGTDVAGLVPEKRGMGMVFQRPLLFPHLSVLDNVAFAERVSGVSRATARTNAEQYLEMVQLAGYGKRSVQELSGGQEQRVAIARALAAKPEVLLLDEPFSALDPALRTDMHELIADIRAALSPTIVLVTHDRDEASAVADRIAILHQGELLQHDTVEIIYTRPASLRVARLMGGLNEIAGTVTAGIHSSAMGRVAVGADVADGPGTLVIRQESVAVAPVSSASDGGGGIESGGAGAAGAGSAGAGGAESYADAGALIGVVANIRRQGPRSTIEVAFARDLSVFADVPPGSSLAVGSHVEVRIPAGAAHLLHA